MLFNQRLKYLSTDCTVVNNRGEFFTRLVKMNSKRVLNFANTQRACVCPLSFDFACFIFADMMVFIPTLKLIFELLCETHKMRRFVTMREPRSPLFPLVSSTLLIESVIVITVVFLVMNSHIRFFHS